MNKKFIFLILMCLLGSLIPMNVMAQEVEIGTSDETCDPNYNIPFGTFYKYSFSQSYYLSSEINPNGDLTGKTIDKIALKVSSHNSLTRNISIYLKDTISSCFQSGNVNKSSVPMKEVDIVFNDNITIDNEGWLIIDITDYTYQGNNLLVTYSDNTGGVQTKKDTYFEVFSTPNEENASGNYDYRTFYKTGSSIFDPTTSISSNTSTYTPKIKFIFKDNSSTPTPPTVTLNTPGKGAKDIFNPSLNFYVSNATGYELFMAKGDGTSAGEYTSLKTGTETGNISYQTSNLESNTTYYWKVVATNNNGTTSDEYTFTTKTFGVPGAATLTSPADGSSSDENPLLSWTFGENTEEQQLLIDGVIEVNWTNIGAKESDQYQTSNLSTGEHTWQVNTRNSAGTTTGTVVYSFTKLGAPDNVTPISPANGATNVSSKTIKWQFAENTTEYRFLYGEQEGQLAYWDGTSYNDTGWIKANGVSEMEIELDDFETSKTYYWAVDVKNAAGERTYYTTGYPDGDDVTTFSFTTTDIFAVTLSTENGIVTNGSANLSWTYGGKNAATHYQVYLGTDKDDLTAVTDWIARGTVDTGYATEGSYTATVSENAVYYWRVDVKKDEGEAVSSEVYSFVNGLSISVSDNDILSNESTTVSWNAIAGATSYNVYVDSNEPINTENNSYELSGLTSGEHTISVKAVYNNEESFASNEVTVNVTAVGTLSITVKDSEGNPIEGATVTLNESTTQTDANGSVSIENLVAGTYEFTVSKDLYDIHTEKDVVINENATTAVNVTLLQSIPDDVTPISPENEATDVYRPTLSWNFAPNTTHYRVLVKGSYKVGGTDNWIETGGAEEGEYEITDQLDANTVYEWCVDVKNARGSRALYSGDADVAIYTFTTSPIAEVNYTAPADNSVTASSEVTLTWNYRNNNEADEYQVLYGTTNPPTAVTDWTPRSTETIADVVSLKMTDSYTVELSVNTKYYWQINVRKGEVVREGAIWSFVTPMDIPENVSVPYTEILPVANQNYGTTTVSWDELSSGAKYNVYVDGNKHNANPIEATSYDITELSIGTHTINVTAVYEGVGESEKSDVLDVTVVGNAEVNIYVEDENGGYVEGATVKFYHIVDEALSGQAYENLNVTNNTGALSVRLGVGKYNMVITKDKYDDFTLNGIEIKSTGYSKTVVLTSDYIFDVVATEKDHDMLAISLERDEKGYFDLYIEKDGINYSTVKGQFFSHNGTSAYHEYSIWGTLPNGRYRFGVAIKDSDIINWSDYVLSRNYAIFENTDGNWNESANWRNGTLPEAHNRIFIYKSCTILEGEGFTAGEINIKDGGSLTLNGSLTVTGEIFNTNASLLVINDGAQLRHNSKSEVKATHIMNIENPTEWLPTNKTGWQFISSMFTDAKISDFTTVDAEDDYDLYKYVGSAELEWVNHKNGDFETSFKQGTAYLASYKVADNVTIDGTLNNEKSFNYQLPYNSNKDLQNFSLIGNPFSFDMDWTKVYAPGLVEGYATVNNDGTYAYHLSGTITAGDGFFVKAASSANYISYNDDKIVTATRNEQNDYINVIASNKSGKDNVIINFAGAEEEGFTKLNNFNDEIANIFITENDKRYGIVNYDRDVKEVELNFIASQMGSYSIKIEPSGEFDYIVLVDKQTGIETNMLLEDEYRFTATNNDKYDRFVLKLSYANNNSDDENSSFVYQSGEDLIIDAEGTIQIIDVIGRVVYEDQVESTNNRISISNLNKSTYVVRSINENGIRTQKIVIL